MKLPITAICWYAQDLHIGDEFSYGGQVVKVVWVHPIPCISQVNLGLKIGEGDTFYVLIPQRRLLSVITLAE